MKNNFDKAMDYIDSNIEKKIDEILKGFIDSLSFDSNVFDKCFGVLTNESLREYIATRKLYFVSQAIKENKDRKLCDIAQDFGYSEQSVLNRVMKKYYGYTPGEIKTKGIIIPIINIQWQIFKTKRMIQDWTKYLINLMIRVI